MSEDLKIERGENDGERGPVKGQPCSNMGKHISRKEKDERVQEVADYLLKWPLSSDYKLHEVFCQQFDVVWQTVNRYRRLAEEMNRKRINAPVDEMALLGKSIILDLLKSPNERTRLKAEEQLRAIMGYGAPAKTAFVNPDGTPLFIPLHVDPKDIVGEGKKETEVKDEKEKEEPKV